MQDALGGGLVNLLHSGAHSGLTISRVAVNGGVGFFDLGLQLRIGRFVLQGLHSNDLHALLGGLDVWQA